MKRKNTALKGYEDAMELFSIFVHTFLNSSGADHE
jgi:hypothetical protein